MASLRLCDRLSYDDFLFFDGPTGSAVAPDANKRDFFHHLGMSENNYRHLLIYRQMKQEASQAMDRLFNTRTSLEPEYFHDARVQPPYAARQMSEYAFQQEVERIYDTASRQTKAIYDLICGEDKRNWVIRWMLWRVVSQANGQGARLSKVHVGKIVSRVPSSSAIKDCSGRSEASSSSPCSPLASNPCYAIPLSPNNSSDGEDLCEREHDLIKLQQKSTVADRRYHRGGYWDHVMNT